METKICQNCKTAFMIDATDFAFYKKIDVPSPEMCPQCRQQARIIFRNFKTLYKRNSDKSGKSMVSMYSSKVPFPVWSHEEWWADDWDAKFFGRDIDFNRPLFLQINELWKVVPRHAVMNTLSTDCVYANFVYSSKNCYLVFGCVDNENCAYGHIVWNSKECLDGLYIFKSQLCYECVDVLGSYRVLYSQECEDCTDSVGLFDCRGCTNCIGCVGLRQKSYYLFNENIGKEAYEQFRVEHPLYDQKSIMLILEKRDELRRKMPTRYYFGSHTTSVVGNHIYNAGNIYYGFDLKSGEDSNYLFTVRKAVDAYDISFTADIEQAYNVLTAANGKNIFCSHCIANSGDAYYSDNCHGCREIFACAGLRNAEYCIFNKQYSKDEYIQLKTRLIAHMKASGEWGKFFPKEMSPFAYNEAIVNEYYPLTKEQALQAGYRWEDDIPMLSGNPTMTAEQLPKDPNTFLLDLGKEILKCVTCGRNYRLVFMEINFYKQLGLAIPHECFNCRHAKRMAMRLPRKLYHRKCTCAGATSENGLYQNTVAHFHGDKPCPNEFETSYSLDRSEIVYCEQCYQNEVI